MLCFDPQSSPALCDPVDCSRQAPPSVGFSRQESWSGLPYPPSGDLPNPGIEPGLPHCRWILYHLSHQGSPRILKWVAYPFSGGSSWPRNSRVSCIATDSLPAELWDDKVAIICWGTSVCWLCCIHSNPYIDIEDKCMDTKGGKGQWGSLRDGGIYTSDVPVCSVTSVVSNSLQLYGLQPTSLLCSWDSPGKHTGVRCHALLQGISLTQGSNPRCV